MATEHDVTQALKTVMFPGIDRDVVALGYVKEIRADGDRFQIRMELSPSAGPVADQIESAARRALDEAGITYDLEVRRPSAPPMPAPPGGVPEMVDPLAHIPIKIAISSGKGGVGKSTAAVNLAIALAQVGQRVGLLDADIYGPSVPLMMGLEGEQPRLDARSQKLLTMDRFGVRTISIGYLVDRHTPVIWRGPMIGKALDQLMEDVDWGDIEILVFDLPPGTGDVQISLAQKIHLSGAIVVTTPQDVALIDAGKGVAMFQKVDVPVLGILENMSYFICPHCGERSDIFRAGGGRREAGRHGVPLLGEIPIDPAVALGGDTGSPIVSRDPDSPAGRAYFEIARRLIEVLEIQPAR